jgi:hypothetical protein
LDSSKRALIRFLQAQEAEGAVHSIRARVSVKREPHGNERRREKGKKIEYSMNEGGR